VVEVGKGDVLLIGTDGIGDPRGTGEGGVRNLLRGALTRAGSHRRRCDLPGGGGGLR
jgi:hypothetical protein